ncbi:MAG: efflux RND transporter periplasmic adaptor subunit [Rhodoferax sp.]|nr:efflux RND transporter periplasmic adaptor subunit [Rhodoferax sp.]
MTTKPLLTNHRTSSPWACVASAAMLVLLGACSRPEPAKPLPGPTVKGDTVSFPDQKMPADLRLASVGRESETGLNVPGRMAWDEDHTARVYAPYAGRIERVRVTLGQVVKRGAALADVSSSDIGQAQADLQKARADEGVSRSGAERARELAEAGVIARKDLQQAEADLARNRAEIGRAQGRLKQYGVSADTITQGLTLTTPQDGIVVERNVNTKAEVRTDVQGPPLFTISNPSTLWVNLDVGETELAAFEPGKAVELRVAAWPELSFPATVTSIGEAVDANSRTVKVRAKVANAEHRLKAEMFVTARVSRPSTLPTVPADGVLLKGDKLVVFVQIAPGQFERREVVARSGGPQSWLVTKGLAPGEKVVVGGALYLDQLLDSAR